MANRIKYQPFLRIQIFDIPLFSASVPAFDALPPITPQEKTQDIIEKKKEMEDNIKEEETTKVKKEKTPSIFLRMMKI